MFPFKRQKTSITCPKFGHGSSENKNRTHNFWHFFFMVNISKLLFNYAEKIFLKKIKYYICHLKNIRWL
jgi:hypothetical protein